jgi:roadblock/LC7 domain-containing protein
LGVEINGYTDSKGKEKNNLILSNLRARSVMQIFVENYVMPQRIILKGYGETKATKENNEKDRRVDINVFQLKNIADLNLLNKSSEIEINKVYPINDTLIPSNKITYKVQIASCTKYKNKKDEVFKGLNVDTYKYGKCINYTYGEFKTRSEAEKALQKVVSKGFDDAFIVKFIDNKRIN